MNQGMAITLAAIGGAILPLQVLVNARLAQGLSNATWAATVSFVIGTAGLLTWLLLSRQGGASWGPAMSLPWWAWFGGLLGAVYVTVTILAVPVIGATALVLLVILGQMVAGTVLDHFGILTEAQPINLQKLLGLALVLGGTWLVVKN